MSLLDFRAEADSGSVTPYQDAGVATKPSSGADIRQAATLTGRYQSSTARSNLTRDAAEKAIAELPAEDRKIIEQRAMLWREEHRAEHQYPGRDPNVVVPDAIDYSKLYNDVLGQEDSPLTPDDLRVFMADTLSAAHQQEAEATANTQSNWPFLQSLVGGTIAGFQDTREQKGMIAALLAGPALGLTSLFNAMGIEALSSAGVTMSYQSDILSLYDELGLGDLYDLQQASANVALGGVLDLGISGGSIGLAKGVGKTADQAAEVAMKLQAKRNEFIDRGANPEVLKEAEPSIIKEAEEDAKETATTGDTPDTVYEEPKMAANRVNAAKAKAAEGNASPAQPVTGKGDGQKVPSLEIGQATDGAVNPGVPIKAQAAFDGKPFNQAATKRAIIEENTPAWIAELESDIAGAAKSLDEGSLAHAVKNKGQLEANIKEQKEVVAYHKSEAKKYAGTDEQAETRKMVKDATGTLTSMRQSLKIMNASLKQKRDLDHLLDELDSLKKTGKLAKRSRYTKQVNAEVKAGKAEHEARAKAGTVTTDINEAKADFDGKLMDVGALPDTRPAKVKNTAESVSLDDDSTYQFDADDQAARDFLADMDADTAVYHMDEDYNASQSTAGDLVQEFDDLMDADAQWRGCI